MPLNELTRMEAAEAVDRLKAKDISPLDLIDAAEARIAEVEPAVNALPTLCFDRARDRAKRLMKEGAPADAARTSLGIEEACRGYERTRGCEEREGQTKAQ